MPFGIEVPADHPAGVAASLLLVDPDVCWRSSVAVALGTRFAVETSGSACAALHLVMQSRPSIVIFDVCLPDLDSVSFVQALRAHRPACVLIAVAAASIATPLETLAQFRIEGFLRKPIDVDELMERVHALLAPPRAQPFAARRFSRHVCHAITYLGHERAHWPTVSEVAGSIGVSSSHLAHVFRSEVGMTVKQYLIRIRMEIAKHLLLESSTNLEALASAVGFCDSSHFSRTFRRSTGCSPGEFRRVFRGRR